METAFVGVVIFIITFAILLFISVYGIKGQSYEEALAEQRLQANLLLGQYRSKPKEKKQKKTGKKVKEKQSSNNESEAMEESDTAEQSPSDVSTETGNEHTRHHVEFREPSADDEEPIEPVKKRLKRDKVRPILVNKDMSEEIVVLDDTCETPAANNFEQLHPKDDFELLHAHIKEEQLVKQEPVKEKVGKSRQNVDLEIKSTKKTPKPANEIIAPDVQENEEITAASSQTDVPGPVVSTVKEKDKKKKKSELNALYQLTGDKQGVNLDVLTTLVRKSEMSCDELQILIDMLLNMQLDASGAKDEWSEGKADPVQKLKRQLAEKEKLLTEEQEATVGAQAKLKEVRAEQVAERLQLQQRTRTLEENLQARQLELQSSNNRFNTVNQKLQQMQAQLNEEVMKNHKLVEEHAGSQMQRQQIDQQIDHLVAQAQEYQATIGQLQTDTQEHLVHSSDLANKLVTLTAQSDIQQNACLQMQNQLGLYKKELDQKDEIIRQMEESRSEFEHRLSQSHKQDGDLKIEISHLKTSCQQQLEEMRRLELHNNQSLKELQVLREQEEGFKQIIFKLKSEVKEAQEEKLKLETEFKSGSQEESKSREIETMNLHNELSSVKSQLQTENKHIAELEAALKDIQKELEDQKSKNNELRKRNWKVMEALKATESPLKTGANNSSQSGANLEETVAKIRQEEQEANRKLVQRLFPDITVSDSLPQDQWISGVEQAIQNYVNKLKSSSQTAESATVNQEIAKLEALSTQYKAQVKHTEGVLEALQTRIAAEETKWDAILKSKDDEIEALKQQHIKPRVDPPVPDLRGVQFAYQCIEKSLPAIINELQTQLSELQLQLTAEQEAKQRLSDEYQFYKSGNKHQSDTIVQTEKIFEEVNRLTEELHVERTKNSELQAQIEEVQNVSSKSPSLNSSNGPSISIENVEN